ncbi:STAS domain-containing protein [candidate division KSB1 bacterium]|nr:STAS domain-containing protein [candidate division KSB1 bacterium]
MKIDAKDYQGVTVLVVKGNLMGGPETIAVHEKVKELIEENKKMIVIDLSHVKWMNSSGLGTMMGCMTSLKNAEGDLKLSGVTEKVKSLFIVTKLVTIFDTYDSAEDAVSAFQK